MMVTSGTPVKFFGVTSKPYRIILFAVNLAAIIVGSITAWGPGVGLSIEAIGSIITGLNLVVLLGHQLLDPSTPTLPSRN